MNSSLGKQQLFFLKNFRELQNDSRSNSHHHGRGGGGGGGSRGGDRGGGLGEDYLAHRRSQREEISERGAIEVWGRSPSIHSADDSDVTGSDVTGEKSKSSDKKKKKKSKKHSSSKDKKKKKKKDKKKSSNKDKKKKKKHRKKSSSSSSSDDTSSGKFHLYLILATKAKSIFCIVWV